MTSAKKILHELQSKARPDQVKGMARFGMTSHRRLGVSVPNMRKIAKESGNDHNLALELWKTGIPEAMIIASMINEPEKLTKTQMDDWIKDISSRDVCNQVCMNLFWI